MMTDPQYPPATARHGRPAPPVTATERRQAANARRGRNILAIVGLVLGAAALVVTFVPGIEFVAWPLAVLGLVLAIIGLVQVKKGTVGDRGLAVTAAAVSVVALLSAAGMLLYSTFF